MLFLAFGDFLTILENVMLIVEHIASTEEVTSHKAEYELVDITSFIPDCASDGVPRE